MHKNGFVYRDLKASHVIINSEGSIKLIDFGFSKKIEKNRLYFLRTNYLKGQIVFVGLL